MQALIGRWLRSQLCFQQVAQLQQSLEEAEKQNMTINEEYRKLLAEKQASAFMMHQYVVPIVL